jgi:beta-glucosidase
MIGTNNCRDNTPEETADGIKAVVGRLREKLPNSKLLLLAIFPRDEKPDSPLRQTNAKASELASKLADNQSVFFLNRLARS